MNRARRRLAHELGCAALACLSLGRLAGAEPAAVPSATTPLDPMSALPFVARDASRSVWVTATNRAAEMDVLRWADERIERIEAFTRIKRGSAGPALRIALLPPRTNAPPATTAQHVEFGSPVQVLTLRGADTMDVALADEALCRLLVWGFVLDHWDGVKSGRDFADWVQHAVPTNVPAWMWRGLSGCLDATARASSSDLTVAEWRAGRLTPLVAFLRAGGQVSAPPGTDPKHLAHLQRAYETMLMSWLLGMPDPDTRLDMLFARIAAGESITAEALAGCLPRAGSAVDLEERWDEWMLAQGHIIYTPGMTRAADLARLREELLVSRGADGIPSGVVLPPHATLREFMTLREAPWMPTVANAKVLRLRTLALGRGEAFQSVVEQYCRYLEAVGARRRVSKLEPLLTAAEQARQALEADLQGPTGGTNSAAAIIPGATTDAPSDND